MGDQRTHARFAGDVVLDAGALIALERGDKELIALMRGALDLGCSIVIPATVLAQIWRGGSRAAHLARLLDAGEIDAIGELRAKEMRLGERGASDVVDAHVVCCAVEFRAAVVTSDPRDMDGLANPDEELTVIAV
jgi:rRNA-processing protein FCF1